MLTDTDAARQIAQRIQAQDASLWEKIVQWFKDFEQKLRSAYNGLKPGSGIAKDAKKTLQQVDGLVKMWADMAVDSAENYRSALSDMEMSNDVEDGVKKSIRNTSKMTWEEQLRENRKGNLRSSDSFYIGETPTVYGDSFSKHPLVMNQSDYKKSSTIKHNVPNRVFKRLPSLLENPIMTFTQDGRTVAVLDDIDADGKPLVAALHALEQMDREAVTAVTSVYGVDNWTSWLANQSKKEIRIHNKTRANSILQTYGSNASVEEAIRSMEESHTTATTDKPISDINRGSSGSMVAQDGDSVKRSSRKEETEQSHKSDASNPYSYESLTAKPDMAVTTLPEDVPKSRADVVYQAKQNAAKIGKFNTKDGSVSVHVKDIGKDVVLGTPGLKHSLDRRLGVNAPVVLKAGEIIENSIRINEMTAQKLEASESYVLIGAARNNSGELYVVRSVVNRFSNELSDMDILYAINAKKEPAALLPRVYGEKSAPSTGSTISIAELLDNVNEYFPDILPEDVLRHFGHESRPEGKLGESALYSSRKAETEESHKEELAKTRARLSKEAQERRENILRDYQKSRKISVENWRMTELGILKSAAENIASLDLSEREKKGLENFSGHLKKLEGIQGEIDAIRSKEGELSQQDLKKLTSLEQQADSMRKLLWEFSEYDVLKKVSQKTRKLLMDKYGSIKPGENPSRQADIPIQTNDLNRVSQTVRTAVEASATSDEMAEKIRQKVVEGEFSYLPITDDDSNKRAEETINRKGWDDALDDWIRIWTRKMLR